ncbi:indolethylamine N-methyltransferase-like [Ixodes scapularis]|uniref:indolethylamine N-methyltransferase-like n=1 Tax=Ixodes scapularis TaxID=6945 RepID=UPI001A9F62A2|nr:indolethylamine N-methyltransferase-like [Ixodes scapularis]
MVSTIAMREALKVTTAALKFGSRHLKDVSPKTRSYSSNTVGITESSHALRASYKANFLARAYVEAYGVKTGEASTFQVEEVHRIFQSGLFQGGTLVEVGSGPLVWCSLLASRRFRHIVLSDLLEGNILEINKWLNKDEDAVDWTFRAEQVAALEGYRDVKSGASEIQKRARSSIRKVVPCDVLEPGVLPEEHREVFDVVFSASCLESATTDHESFRYAVCNVGTLAKPGGLLFLVGVGGIKSYPVGTATFAQANVTENVIKQFVRDAGFQMQIYRTKHHELLIGLPGRFTFVLVARKS